MKYCITHSWAAIRTEPSPAAEMSTCILYGERCEIIDEKDGWVQIKIDYDNYIGWIGKYYLKPLALINPKICNKKNAIINNLFELPVGAEYSETDLISNQENVINTQSISTIAKEFLHAPYLWGGRTQWGIDCSGLVQIAMKLQGHQFPRDAKDQALEGEEIGFENIQENDLAFFKNPSNKITHVGIILAENKIIHAHGFVRIDTLTQQGIYNADRDCITHELCFVKRNE